MIHGFAEGFRDPQFVFGLLLVKSLDRPILLAIVDLRVASRAEQYQIVITVSFS